MSNIRTYQAEVQVKNRVTIPLVVRKLLNIEEGDIVEVQIKKLSLPLDNVEEIEVPA